MMTLQEAWVWYEETKKLIALLRRLAARHWDRLPWEQELGRDDAFKTLEAPPLVNASNLALSHLDDVAIVLLFSVFESTVRDRILVPVEEEIATIRHPTLRFAADEVVEVIRKGSFRRVLDSLKAVDVGLVEQVRQVRRYRNWISHGRRGAPPSRLDPRTAYMRLSAFLQAIERSDEDDGGDGGEVSSRDPKSV